MRPDIFLRRSSFPYSLTHSRNPSSVGNLQQTENSISFHITFSPISLLYNTRAPSLRETVMISPRTYASGCPHYLGCHSSVCWGQQRRGRNACLGFAQVPATAGLRGALSATRSPAHRPHLRGARSPWAVGPTSIQGAVDPRSHHQLQKDPATLPKQVTLLQCFIRGQEQPESGDTIRVWAPGLPAGPGAGK